MKTLTVRTPSDSIPLVIDGISLILPFTGWYSTIGFLLLFSYHLENESVVPTPCPLPPVTTSLNATVVNTSAE